MTLNAELAAAARWVRARAEQLPEATRPDIAGAWAELMDAVDEARSDGAAQLIVIQWREDMAERLAVGLAHAPLEGTANGGTR